MDGGVTDGEPAELSVGCGCVSAAGLSPLLLLLCLRRRRVER